MAQTTYKDSGLVYNEKGELLNGEFVQLSKKDNITKVLHYKNGLLYHEVLVYTNKGKLLEKREYVIGQKHGTWTYWNIDGIKISELYYTQNQKDGKVGNM
ncbi:MAG: hypothetical protein AAGI07_02670 [Bacteroidota bacterium]